MEEAAKAAIPGDFGTEDRGVSIIVREDNPALELSVCGIWIEWLLLLSYFWRWRNHERPIRWQFGWHIWFYIFIVFIANIYCIRIDNWFIPHLAESIQIKCRLSRLTGINWVDWVWSTDGESIYVICYISYLDCLKAHLS